MSKRATIQSKVRAAAIAGWCVVLIATALLIVSRVSSLVIISAKPSWLLSMWGPDLSWAYIQYVWFWAIVTSKLIVWVMALAAMWLLGKAFAKLGGSHLSPRHCAAPMSKAARLVCGFNTSTGLPPISFSIGVLKIVGFIPLAWLLRKRGSAFSDNNEIVLRATR